MVFSKLLWHLGNGSLSQSKWRDKIWRCSLSFWLLYFCHLVDGVENFVQFSLPQRLTPFKNPLTQSSTILSTINTQTVCYILRSFIFQKKNRWLWKAFGSSTCDGIWSPLFIYFIRRYYFWLFTLRVHLDENTSCVIAAMRQFNYIHVRTLATSFWKK